MNNLQTITANKNIYFGKPQGYKNCNTTSTLVKKVSKCN